MFLSNGDQVGDFSDLPLRNEGRELSIVARSTRKGTQRTCLMSKVLWILVGPQRLSRWIIYQLQLLAGGVPPPISPHEKLSAFTHPN